jgi:hypothetical protein
MGHPAGGVVGLGSLIELWLAIRVFAKDRFKTEAWGARPKTSSGREALGYPADSACENHIL